MSPQPQIPHKESKVWDWLIKGSVPIVVALCGWGVKSEIAQSQHEIRIQNLEGLAIERTATLRSILDRLTEIQVTIGRLDERLRKSEGK